MTYYHATKDEALEAAAPYAPYWLATAALEPYNGWVITLRPNPRHMAECLAHPLAPLLSVAELDLGRLWQRPDSYKRPPSTAAKPTAKPPSPPAKPPPPPKPPGK